MAKNLKEIEVNKDQMDAVDVEVSSKSEEHGEEILNSSDDSWETNEE